VVAPADILSVRPGHASLEVNLVSGQSAVTSAFTTSPMKLLTPRSRGESVWACTSSFGGGLVAGDQTRLELTLGPGARCYLGTQASTKIYRNPAALPSGHETYATLGTGSLLVFVPDPVQAFAGSTYTQRQEFHLAPDASLVLLDWFTSGRAARGERWVFSHFASRNEVHLRSSRREEAHFSEDKSESPHVDCYPQNQDELAFLDSLRLDPDDGPLDSPHRTGRFNCLATLLMLGPLVRDLAGNMLANIASRPVERRTALVCSASPVRDGALLRVAGEQAECVARELHRHLAPLAPLLGDDPWARKW
jgi:urease accessory protein